MKLGTVLCWLFGHKFLLKVAIGMGPVTRTRTVEAPSCVRCGNRKPSAKATD